MPTVTVFTPVYNRGYCISNLYASLCRQTCKDFEWVVVDDGSTDNIDELMRAFATEDKIIIRYFKQPNGGKHRAINYGVKEALGELFFIVDSDDYLVDDAVSWIIECSLKVKDDGCFAGLSGIRIKPDGTKIGGGCDFGLIDADAMEIRYKYGVTGDLAEIYKTDILKQFPFPEYEGERFCPEALVWNRIARRYKLRYYYKGIYVCEYLSDGLTAKIVRLRKESPKASMKYYSEYFHQPIPMVEKIKAAINFWRFAFAPYNREYMMLSLLPMMAYIPGRVLRIADKLKL